jgi:hypothetical protein
LVGLFGPHYPFQSARVLIQHLLIQKKDGAEGLVLSGCSHTVFNGKMGKKHIDFRRSHIFGVAFVVKQDIASDPLNVGFFRSYAVVAQSDGRPHLIEKPRLFVIRIGGRTKAHHA